MLRWILWNLARNDMMNYIEKAAQRHRLKKNNLDDVIEYCHTPNLTTVIPVLKDNYLMVKEMTFEVDSLNVIANPGSYGMKQSARISNVQRSTLCCVLPVQADHHTVGTGTRDDVHVLSLLFVQMHVGKL